LSCSHGGPSLLEHAIGEPWTRSDGFAGEAYALSTRMPRMD
jgi:hypothetical protein